MPAETIWRDAGEIDDLLDDIDDLPLDTASSIRTRVSAIRAAARQIIDRDPSPSFTAPQPLTGAETHDVREMLAAHIGAGSPAPLTDAEIDHMREILGDLRGAAPLDAAEIYRVREMLGEFYPAPSEEAEDVGLPSLHHIEDTVKHWAEDDLRPLIDAVKKQVDGIESDVQGYVEAAVKDDVLPAVGYGMELVLRQFAAQVIPVLSDLAKIWAQAVPDSAQIKLGWLLASWSDTSALKAAVQSGELVATLDQASADMSPTEAWQVIRLLAPDQVGIDAEVQVPVVDVGVGVQALWDLDDFEAIAGDIVAGIKQ